jgi:hypothetical protein
MKYLWAEIGEPIVKEYQCQCTRQMNIYLCNINLIEWSCLWWKMTFLSSQKLNFFLKITKRKKNYFIKVIYIQNINSIRSLRKSYTIKKFFVYYYLQCLTLTVFKLCFNLILSRLVRGYGQSLQCDIINFKMCFHVPIV